MVAADDASRQALRRRHDDPSRAERLDPSARARLDRPAGRFMR